MMKDNEIISMLTRHCTSKGHAKHLVNLAFPKQTLAIEDAEQLLIDHLPRGVFVRLSKLMTLADEQGIHYRTLRRAAINLRVKSSVTGFGKDRVAKWFMPKR